MRRLGETAARLADYRRRWEEIASLRGHAANLPTGLVPDQNLTEVTDFGSNPGNLRMFCFVPERRPAAPALVMVLHGCTQSAAGYNQGAGWSTLADRYGFVVLFPEQQTANNPKGCFNWFQPSDTTRGRGEALSIRQMVEAAVVRHGIDRSRIFVTGLSAGGAMTSVMLATYPEVFAGGAVIAGLPYGAATNLQEALESMFQGRSQSGKEWGDFVRVASPHRGAWPKISVWHGSADSTVQPMNADEIVKQWVDLHRLDPEPTGRDTVNGYPRRVWQRDGETVIESYTITNMAHGTPLATGEGEHSVGAAGPFLLETGISSSYHIAQFWGLTSPAERGISALGGAREEPSAARPEVSAAAAATPPAADLVRETSETEARKPEQHPPDARESPSRLDIGSIIMKALRQAGLMKGQH